VSVLVAALKASSAGEIDVDMGSGKVKMAYLAGLQRDLGLAYQPENWDAARIVRWLCDNLPEPTLTHDSKQSFVVAWLSLLMVRPEFALTRVNVQKFLIRDLLRARIRALRQLAIAQGFQQTLFGDAAAVPAAVTDQHVFEFQSQIYAPIRDYEPQTSPYGNFEFRKHYYGRIGDFDSREEFECACELDRLAQLGRIRFWVRNLVRREGCSFFLQKANGRFYPDFLCLLPPSPGSEGQPGAILAVEYKGENLWTAAEDDRQIGHLWAGLSRGRCRFVMLQKRQWFQIETQLDAGR
jgi:type III restriction enzyme